MLQAAATASPASGAGSATVEFGVSLGDLTAASLGLPENHASVWQIGLQLTSTQACMAPGDLREAVRAIFLGYLSSTASPVASVGIASSSVAMGGVACGRRDAPAGPSAAAATGSFETVIVFQAGSAPLTMSAGRFRLMPGVLSIEPVAVPSSILIGDAPAASSDAAATAPSEAGSGKTAVIAAAVASVIALAAVAGGIALRLRASRRRDLQQLSKEGGFRPGREDSVELPRCASPGATTRLEEAATSVRRRSLATAAV